jgi:hypothetical protein
MKKPAHLFLVCFAFLTMGIFSKVAAQSTSVGSTNSYPDSMKLNVEYQFDLIKNELLQQITLKPIGNDSLEFNVIISETEPLLGGVATMDHYSGIARLSLLTSYQPSAKVVNWEYTTIDEAFVITIYGPDAYSVSIVPTKKFNEGFMNRKK